MRKINKVGELPRAWGLQMLLGWGRGEPGEAERRGPARRGDVMGPTVGVGASREGQRERRTVDGAYTGVTATVEAGKC